MADEELYATPTRPSTSNTRRVYIPFCKKDCCTQWLQKIDAELKKFRIPCTADHPVYGKYKSWFQQYFDECDFTIIHYCPYLWEKISPCGCVEKDDKKCILIRIMPNENDFAAEDKSMAELKRSMDAYFKEMDSEQLIENYNDLKIFAKKIVTAIKPGYKAEIIKEEYSQSTTYRSSYKPSTNEDYSIYNTYSDSSVYQYDDCVSERHKEKVLRRFEKYGDLFGSLDNMNVFIRSCDVQWSTSMTFEYVTPKDLVEQINEFKADDIQSMNYILHRLLPMLYRDKKILEMSSIACCRWITLRERALILLEFMLWESADDVYMGILDVHTLITACTPLSESLQKLREENTKNKKQKNLMLIEHITHIILMIFSNVVASQLKNQQQAKKAESFMRSMREELGRSRNKDDKVYETLKIFLSLPTGESYRGVWSTAAKFITNVEDVSSEYSPKKLLKEQSCVQFVVVYELLRKVYCLNKSPLKFLDEYLKPLKGVKDFLRKTTTRPRPPSCLTMMFRGLILFISYGVRKSEHMDVKKICVGSMHLIKVAAERNITDEIGRCLLSLLFDPRDFIRCGIIEIFKRRQSYQENLMLYSLNAIEQLLFPFVKRMPKASPKTQEKKAKDKSNSVSSDWFSLNISFAEKPAQMFVNTIYEKDHMQFNKTHFQEQKDMRFTEILHLAKLRHENIIEMIAFQTAKMPQFYILEEGQHLQIMLKNARDNQKTFRPDFLCKLLQDALKGLKYCHDQGYIHRDLTADSLCVINNMQSVKLCGFGICMKKTKSGLAIELNSKNIPLRWSAPESICNGEFSTLSDIWMAGHLIYEVLTHGLLPYSTFLPSDEQFMEALQSGNITLQREFCLHEKTVDLILRCADYDSQNRPSIEEVCTYMEDIYEALLQTSQEMVNYPAIGDDKGKSSTAFSRGIPQKYLKVTDTSSGSSQSGPNVILPDGMNVIQSANDDIYDVKVYQPMSSDTKASIHCRELQDLLPYIKLDKTSDGTEKLKCSIPRTSTNLYELISQRRYGSNISYYMTLILKVAENLCELHRRSWIVGDLSPSLVFIDTTVLKPYIASLSCLKFIDQQHSTAATDESVKLPSTRISSAAPEVITGGQLSLASDVFCFGNFLWVLLTVFDKYDEEYTIYEKYIVPFDGMSKMKVYQALMLGKWSEHHSKPQSCSEELYRLILQCVNVSDKKRPTMLQICENLKRMFDQERILMEENPSGGSHLSSGNWSTRTYKKGLLNFFGDKKKLSLLEDNPSVYSENAKASNDIHLNDVDPYELDNPYETQNIYEAIDDSNHAVGSNYQRFSANALTLHETSSVSTESWSDDIYA